MPGPSLRSILGQKSSSMAVVRALCAGGDADICVIDLSGKALLGTPLNGSADALPRYPILAAEQTLGHVFGAGQQPAAIAELLSHLAAREHEQRALAHETLTLYREIHLIEQLSEELNALLDTVKISEASLAQARRLVSATHGAVLIRATPESPLTESASFCDDNYRGLCIEPDSQFIASALERGVAEIVNNCATDARASDTEKSLRSLIVAPLRAGQATVGIIVLANAAEGEPYNAANLKFLNTIALQTATAIRNAILCAEMVESARSRAAYAAELQAASSVQQLLMQGASRHTPGFKVESVYLPASEVGGDFFFVQPGGDGSLLAIVGDVSGKGLTAAMRVSMILGALRREASDEPAEILFNLNNVLVAQGQLGFTTACCLHIHASGDFSFANAGHISLYLSGVEVPSESALPLGIVPGQQYAEVRGAMLPADHIILMSDGVPEARSASGELLGFTRVEELTRHSAREIAHAAQTFGQEDDITVLRLQLS